MRLTRFARALWRNRTGAVPRPSWCTYLVTYRCNARCQMCDSWRLKPGAELDVPAVAQLFAQIGKLDVVRLSGGEPFLRDDMSDLGRAVLRASDPLILHITTNGSFPDKVEAFARKLPRRRLRIMVSLDGLAQEHDRNRGADVSFALALETVERMRTLGVAVSVNHTVISPQSLADAAPLRARLDALGVDVHVVLAYADSAMYGLKRRGRRAEDLIVADGYPLHPALQDADVIGFVERELAALDAIGNPVTRLAKRYYLRGLRARLKREPWPQPRCTALRSHVRLLPDGSVPVCQFNTERVGELRTEPFAQVWAGEKARAAREWVDACSGCWAECEVLPSAIYTGDLLRALR